MNKINDLTILLRMIDKTKGPFKKIESRMEKLGKKAKALSSGFKVIGVAAAAAFGAAIANGREIAKELNLMSSALGVSKREADALFETVREAAPTAEIDKVKEAVLTLQEGFFDARAESGPLFDLIKDFGVDIDLSLTEPKAQLEEFLRVLRQLPDDTIRAGAVISNLGADDAKPFLEFANNADKLDQAIIRLSGSIDDIPNVITQSQQENIDKATESAGKLSAAWDNFSEKAYAFIAPALTIINNGLSILIGWASAAVVKIGEFFGIFDDNSDSAKNDITDLTSELKALTDQQTKLNKEIRNGPGRTSSNLFDSSETRFGSAVEITPPIARHIDLIALDKLLEDLPKLDVTLKKMSFSEFTDKMVGLAGDIGSISSVLDDVSQSAFENEISKIESQTDILDTKTQELNDSRIRNQLMMQQMGVANLKQNPFDGELEKIKRQKSELDTLTAQAYQARKKDFERNKKIQKAVAIVENIAAGVKAFNAAGGGWWGAGALAASLATGYAQVKKICDTRFDGSGAGSIGTSGGGAGAGQGNQQANQPNGTTFNVNDLLNQNTSPTLNITIEGSTESTFTFNELENIFDGMVDAGFISAANLRTTA